MFDPQRLAKSTWEIYMILSVPLCLWLMSASFMHLLSSLAILEPKEPDMPPSRHFFWVIEIYSYTIIWISSLWAYRLNGTRLQIIPFLAGIFSLITIFTTLYAPIDIERQCKHPLFAYLLILLLLLSTGAVNLAWTTQKELD